MCIYADGDGERQCCRMNIKHLRYSIYIVCLKFIYSNDLFARDQFIFCRGRWG